MVFRRSLLGALSGLLLLSALPVFAGQGSEPATAVAPKPPIRKVRAENPLLKAGTIAPDFTVTTVDGKSMKLSSLRGKTVILDFWATWCGPCQVSMPGLEKIYGQIKGKNVVVLSVNTWDEKADFQKWVAENSGSKYHFTFVRDPAEGDHDAIRKNSIARRLYNVPGIPTMYVIDKNGKIVDGLIGSGNEKNLVRTLKKVGLSAQVPAEAPAEKPGR